MISPALLAAAGPFRRSLRIFAKPAVSLFLVSILIMAYQFSHASFVSCFVDDSILHISWCTQFKQALLEGQWIPRWLPLANGGYGSPVFVFYPPLVYYVTALFGLVLPVVTAMKVVKLLGFFLSGWTMYGFAGHLFGRAAALPVALLYQVLPYHILDNYYWTFYAETWAWVWFPLILHGLLRCIRDPENRQGYVSTTLSYAALILTHLVSAFMFGFVATAFVVWQGARSWRRWWFKLTLAALGCMAITAYYVFPMFYEQRFVHIDQIVKLVNYENTFVFFPNEAVHKHYRFFLNIILLLQWVTGFQMLLTVASAWIFRRPDLERGVSGHFRYFLGLTLICVLLTTEWSLWLWRGIPGFSQIQFPMRWMAFMTLGCSLVGGTAFIAISKKSTTVPLDKVKSLVWMSSLFFCSLLSLGIIVNSCFLEEEASRLAQIHAYNATEYNPKWTPHPEQRLTLQQDPPFQLVSGQGQVEVEQWHSHARTLNTTANEPILVKLRLFDYPGWTASLDGSPHLTQREERSGIILVTVPAGRHQLKLRFEDTIWRQWSKWVSIAGVVAMGFVWTLSARRQRVGKDSFDGKETQPLGSSVLG